MKNEKIFKKLDAIKANKLVGGTGSLISVTQCKIIKLLPVTGK